MKHQLELSKFSIADLNTGKSFDNLKQGCLKVEINSKVQRTYFRKWDFQNIMWEMYLKPFRGGGWRLIVDTPELDGTNDDVITIYEIND